MPDAYGLPNHSDVYTKLSLTAPDDIQNDLDADVDNAIADAIAFFQAPTAFDDAGGTGRLWQPRTETRFFDGTGYSELRVDDLLPPATDTNGNPVNPIAVTSYDCLLPSVGVKAPVQAGLGYNTLFFQGGDILMAGYLRGFPIGVQNIGVTATWGNVVTPDIFEAIRCEAVYMLLVEGFVGLNGIGESVTIGDYSLNTSVGAINFKLTSPLTVFHDKFLRAVKRYRERPDKGFKRFGASRRMS